MIASAPAPRRLRPPARIPSTAVARHVIAQHVAAVSVPGLWRRFTVPAATTRTATVCAACGEYFDAADAPEPTDDCAAHGVELATVTLLRASALLGRTPVTAATLTPTQVETVRAYLEGIRAERGWLTTTEERALASCDSDPAYAAEAYNALVRTGAAS